MNANIDAVIKQEFLTAEEKLNNCLENSDFSISVKNEPIYDEHVSFVTIKSEPLNEAACFMENVSVKTENVEELTTTLELRDNFVFKELKTELNGQSQKNIADISKTDTLYTSKNLIQNAQAPKNANSKISNVSQCTLSNLQLRNEVQMNAVSPPPFLLNDKLRKRHKVIVSTKQLDKRKRYNIEETQPTIEARDNTILSSEASRESGTFISGKGKIINYIMKNKQKRSKAEKNCTKKNNAEALISEQNLVTSSHQIGQRVTPSTQIQPETVAPTSPSILPSRNDVLNVSKQSPDSSNIPELRVKCLCSLTTEASCDNSDLEKIFHKIFEETRRLNKTQQRKVKITLLKAICDAEDLVEQGKCCGFLDI